MSSSRDNPGGTPNQDGRHLRVFRAERLLSIRDLGLLAGVAPSTIYMIEAGRSTPQLSIVRRISEALQIDPMAVTEFRHAIRARAGMR